MKESSPTVPPDPQIAALKYIGNPDPYPGSKNPDNAIVHPTADNLKL